VSVVIELVRGADQLAMLEVSAVPAVGDRIELKGGLYEVMSRQWQLAADRIYQVTLRLGELKRPEEP